MSSGDHRPPKGFGTAPTTTPTVTAWQHEADKDKNRSAWLLDTSLPCPCGGGVVAITTGTTGIKSYEHCCAPYHRGEAHPASPRLLLQSRYSAFVLRDIRYIIETTHPINADWRDDKVAWVKELNRNMFDNHDFCGLEASDADEMVSDAEGYLAFTVRLRGKDGSEFETQDLEIRERSRFLKDEKGRWLYASGDVNVVQE